MKLPLAYYGDSVLRQKAKPVTEFGPELRQLVDDMLEAMADNDGMGLAAPQVHKSIALFVTKVPEQDEEGKWIDGPVIVFINPKIEWVSEEVWETPEGCLSIPGIKGDVVRPFKVRVSYYDLDGNKHTDEFSSWQAKAVMHENDHINGVLYIDRMDSRDRKAMEHHLQQVKKKYSGKKK